MYDAIVIGGGHNGLVTAGYLARAGKKVLVLERRALTGGSVVTENFGEGFQVDSVWAGGILRQDIVKTLKLPTFGYPAEATKPAFTSVLSKSDRLVIDPEPIRAAESIKRYSEKDATRWPEFVATLDRAASFLDFAYATRMPRLPRNFDLKEGYDLAELLLELRLMGRKDMHQLLRMLPMSAVEFLEEWFESEQLKAALASVAIHGVTLGVMSGGTGYTLLHNWLNRRGLGHQNVGRAGDITGSLARAITAHGGEVRTNAEVMRIQVDTYTCKGVMLTSGEEIPARTIIPAVDPKRTFLKLVGAENLSPEFVWNVQSIKMRGSVAKLHLLLDRPPGAAHKTSIGQEATQPHPGTMVIAPSLNYLERAYDAAKYGRISEKPYLEITTTGNVVNVHVQYAPYALKAEDWNNQREALEDVVLNTLDDYFPNLRASIVNRRLFTPLDLEQTYALTEGDLNHGQLMLDQFLFMRPIPGWSNHKTPIDGLYLCGSGVHGGGGVSGAAGRNAALALMAR